MRNLDYSDNENPAFRNWKWMISDDENDKEDDENDEDKKVD